MNILSDAVNEQRKHVLPSHLPNSHEKFIERLRTFDVSKWFAKPNQFSPISCCKHGWTNYSKDTLKCVTCSKTLYIHSSNSTKANSSILIETHNTHCPWRTLSVSDNQIEVNLTDKLKVFEDFKLRIKSFDKSNKLPLLTDNIEYEFMPVDFDLFSQNENIQNFKTKLILSSCGWSYNSSKDILNCSKCLRTIGTWLYKENDENKDIIENILNRIINTIELKQERHKNEILNQFTGKRKCDALNDDIFDIVRKSRKSLNPINEHHSWCPWLILNNEKLNYCQVNFSIVIECLLNEKDTSLNVKKSISNDITYERIKSVQKLLINCTPKCMLSS